MQLAICRNNFYQLQHAACRMQHAECNTRNSQLLTVNIKSFCSRFLCVLIFVAANNKFNLIFNCRPKGCGALIK